MSEQIREKAPRVSVLMPVYNAGAMSRTAIESILNQTMGDFELIIVNDGSTDDTARHVSKYGDARIRVIELEENVGPTRALNAGLRECRGEYVARQDADDWSDTERLAGQAAFLDARPEFAAVGCGFRRVDARGVTHHFPPAEQPEEKPLKKLAGCIPHSGAMLRKSDLLAVGGYDCNFRYAQDFKLWIDLARRGRKIGAAQKLLMTYNIHAAQISTMRKKEQDACAARVRASVDLPRVGILIIAFNRLTVTRAAVERLIANTDGNYTLYLFDNGSTDGTGDYFRGLAAGSGNIKFIRSEENQGCPGGREYMMRLIDNEYVAWIDDDMMVRSGWLPPLVEALDADPRAGAASMLFHHDAGEFRINLGGVIERLSGDHWMTHPNTDAALTSGLLYFCGGASLIRRAAYNWSAPFGDAVDYAEDIYIGMKMSRDGWKIIGVPESVGDHVPESNQTRNEYNATRRVGGEYTRSAVDRIKKEFGINLIRNRGWARSCGARVLLIFPPLPPAREIKPLGLPPAMFPQGLGFVAAYLARCRQNARIIDYRVENPLIAEELKSFDPDWVGVYTSTIGWKTTEKFISGLRGMTRSPIVAGGPHASLFPERIPDYVDHVVCGEGEYAMMDLVEGKVRERVIRAQRISNLDALPWPDWNMFAGKPYARTDNEGFGLERMASMNTSRGCVFGCKFCSGRKILGRGYTCFSPEKVGEGAAQLKALGYRSIYFREDNFTADAQRAIDIASVMSRLGMRWAAESRVDTLDEGAVRHFARCGCAGLYVGVESGSQRVLDAMNKRTTVELTEKFFGWCRGAGIRTYASVIVGYPGETDEDRRLTEELLRRIGAGKVCRNPYVAMPGSDAALEFPEICAVNYG